MKRIKLVIFLFLFLVGVVSVIAFRLWQINKARRVAFTPQSSSFILQAPRDALKGKLSMFTGKITKKPRNKEEFKNARVGEEILQGEKIATGQKSQAVIEFANVLRVNLGSDAEIGFINLIPENFLMSQSLGLVTYELLDNKIPVSVRGLHVLLTINSGKSEFTINNDLIVIKVLSGSAKLAIVDLENKTHVWEIAKGQQVLVNDTERKIEVK